uniref:Auxin-repressed 12.5 kDa protein n=1 Tax=Fragaria ananassa TaxID=3747 RepID=12KD_FRAAN|nr:RecName: Full=Auxin-repressed 12.5 kDa protein [Fragaria x ananassa]AAA73872.1 auxin-repressed protein [Fragaria x ananassa]CAA36676.1 12.5 kDa protein [Fragaria x ananassa]
MVLLDKLWDDIVAGPQPERGLGMLRKVPQPLNLKDEGESSKITMPTTPTTPVTPTTPISARKDNVWRSVFHPGSNLSSKTMGNQVFDSPQPNSPTVYDWMYSGETRSKHHR